MPGQKSPPPLTRIKTHKGKWINQASCDLYGIREEKLQILHKYIERLLLTFLTKFHWWHIYKVETALQEQECITTEHKIMMKGGMITQNDEYTPLFSFKAENK